MVGEDIDLYLSCLLETYLERKDLLSKPTVINVLTFRLSTGSGTSFHVFLRQKDIEPV